MSVVADSGPLIHIAIVGQFPLLRRYFHKLLIIPQVYDELIAAGFHLDPHGWVYQDALKRVGEIR